MLFTIPGKLLEKKIISLYFSKIPGILKFSSRALENSGKNKSFPCTSGKILEFWSELFYQDPGKLLEKQINSLYFSKIPGILKFSSSALENSEKNKSFPCTSAKILECWSEVFYQDPGKLLEKQISSLYFSKIPGILKFSSSALENSWKTDHFPVLLENYWKNRQYPCTYF